MYSFNMSNVTMLSAFKLMNKTFGTATATTGTTATTTATRFLPE